MIALDTRSGVSNLRLADALRATLDGWDVEMIDCTDDEGLPKRNLVARDPGSRSPLAFAGHLGTVSAVGRR